MFNLSQQLNEDNDKRVRDLQNKLGHCTQVIRELADKLNHAGFDVVIPRLGSEEEEHLVKLALDISVNSQPGRTIGHTMFLDDVLNGQWEEYLNSDNSISRHK